MRVRMTTVYRDWIIGLRDHMARARIQVRVDRLVHGNPGSHRVLSEGVSELKIDVGPGYRVYFTERDGELIILPTAEIRHAPSNPIIEVEALPYQGLSPWSRAHPHGCLRRLEATPDTEGNGGLPRGLVGRGPR